MPRKTKDQCGRWGCHDPVLPGLPRDRARSPRLCAKHAEEPTRDARRSALYRVRPEVFDSWEERELFACAYCGHPFEELDHIVPRALEGTDDIENLVPACASCNSMKADRPFFDFIEGVLAPKAAERLRGFRL